MGGQHLNAPIVGVARTPDAVKARVAASDGGVFIFGDAYRFRGFHGRSAPQRLPSWALRPPVGWPGLLACGQRRGDLSAFRHAEFHGSMERHPAERPCHRHGRQRQRRWAAGSSLPTTASSASVEKSFPWLGWRDPAERTGDGSGGPARWPGLLAGAASGRRRLHLWRCGCTSAPCRVKASPGRLRSPRITSTPTGSGHADSRCQRCVHTHGDAAFLGALPTRATSWLPVSGIAGS